MEFLNALKFTAIASTQAILDLSMWKAIFLSAGEVLFGLFVLTIRMIVLLTFPISFPLIAYFFMKKMRRIKAAYEMFVGSMK